MEEKYYSVEEVSFAKGILTVRVASLHTGQPDGLIGLPLTKTPESRSYLVTFKQVGRFRVLREPWNQLKDPFESLAKFVHRQLQSPYLAQNLESVTIFNPDVPHGAQVQHYVVYGENYVVDVLAADSPTIRQLDRQSS